MICLLILWWEWACQFRSGCYSTINIYVLSAGEEAVGLGHLGAVFQLAAQLEKQSLNAEDDGEGDGSVPLPVGRLAVPATRGRPDVLGVAADGESGGQSSRDCGSGW